jgi:hypothetical protein
MASKEHFQLRRFFRSLRLQAVVLACFNIYLGATILSLIAAHVLLIARPDSGLAERIIAPVAKGLEFLDAHWRSVVILIASPFVAPIARDLVGRLRKIGGVEFDAVPLEPQGVREKPALFVPGASQ